MKDVSNVPVIGSVRMARRNPSTETTRNVFSVISKREPVQVGRESLSLTAKRVCAIMDFSIPCGREILRSLSMTGSSGKSEADMPIIEYSASDERMVVMRFSLQVISSSSPGIFLTISQKSFEESTMLPSS